MPLRTPLMARLRLSVRAHATAAILAAVAALVLTLSSLGDSHLAAEEQSGCAHGQATVTAAAATPCSHRAEAAPAHGRHPGHDPSSTQTCLVATATHRPLCHTLLPAVDPPAISGLPPVAAASTAPVPSTPADCHPPAIQREILRC